MVAIKRTHFGPVLKQPTYLGPYEVSKIKRNDRYYVEKVEHFIGPNKTSTAVDFMKPWLDDRDTDSERDSSGTDE